MSALGSPISVLFLCTGNSARSILSECLLNDLGGGLWHAYSAGSQPSGQPHPDGLLHLAAQGHSVEGYSSKSWDVFSGPEAPRIDIIITVCDSAAAEVCPVWPDHPFTVHWPAPDPAHIEPEMARKAAFADVYKLCRARIEAMLRLDVNAMTSAQLQLALAEIANL